jgi:hypothetical protein
MAVARFSPTELDVTVRENRFLVTGKAHKAKGGSLTAKRAAAGAGFPDAVRGAESGPLAGNRGGVHRSMTGFPGSG